jgi:hypothetical protein
VTSDPVMINQQQLRLILKIFNNGPRPLTTLWVWNAVLLHIQRDTGEIAASACELADDAGTTADEVAWALNRLAEIGALLKLRPGRYAINPHVGWMGDPLKRQEAAKDVPPVRLIEP